MQSGDSDSGSSPSPAFTPIVPNYPVVEDLFPRNTISLLAGSAFSGKSALLYSSLRDYLRSGNFLGYSAPRDSRERIMMARIGYISGSKTLEEMLYDISKTGIPEFSPLPFQLVSQQSSMQRELEFPRIEDLYQQFTKPRPQFVIVDGLFGFCTGKVYDYQDVGHFMGRLKRFCYENDVTILATAPTAKAKADELYSGPERILGSQAWACEASTVLILEIHIDERNGRDFIHTLRRLEIWTRTKPPEDKFYDFNDSHHLVLVSGFDNDWRQYMTNRLSQIAEGVPLETRTLVSWAAERGISVSATETWITQSVASNLLERLRRGIYRRPYQT